jgi:FMN phosphatase YigB (HAD superfamily)
MKIVIFDLDETLGYFVEFGMFWDGLLKYISLKNKDVSPIELDFNKILDLYPEFLRPHIIPILNYLKHKKESKCCHKLMIYTNNQGSDLWASKIISYFNDKIKIKLFDQIISAFKINGKRIEICRSTHDKTYHDLIKCTKIPKNAEICFLDDNYFPGMVEKNVYYIHVKPYIHDLPFELMINRFVNSKIGKDWINEEDFKNFMLKYLNSYNFTYIEKTIEEEKLDKVVSKEIMIHIQYFFTHKNKSKKTKNHKNKINSNLTRKKK